MKEINFINRTNSQILVSYSKLRERYSSKKVTVHYKYHNGVLNGYFSITPKD